MKTGIIGLGAMGTGMAGNFHKHGKLHAVWNRTKQKAVEFADKTGVEVAESPAKLASECDLIVSSLSRDRDVIEIMELVAEGIRPRAIVVDTSTVSADTARKAAGILKQKNANFLDCPVSGGVEGAINGKLVMMVGGDSAVLDRVRDTLSAIAIKISHIGATGSGQACKAVNQLMAAGINQAVTEALAFGQAMGLDMDKVVDIICGGAAGNWFLAHRGKTMLAGKFEPGFKLGLHYKDLRICQEMAKSLSDDRLPMIEMTLIHYQRLMDEGFADDDISALFRIKKRLFE